MSESGVKVVKDNTANMEACIRALVSKAVFVGIPAEDNDRKGDNKIGNAAIGYMAENGSPARNIPERPHLIPGIRRVQARIASLLRKAAKNCLKGDIVAVDDGLNAAGMVAVSSVRGLIQEGLAPALADATVRARAARGRKGAKAELASRAAGNAPSSEGAKPYWDTGEYKNALTYVLRKIKNA